MLTIREIEDYFHSAAAENLEIVLELRNLIFAVDPDAVEMIQWKGISYFDATCGGPVSGSICQVHIIDGVVRLGFIHGVFLRDPAHLLNGSRKVKRYVEIPSYGLAPWEELKALIQASYEFDPYTMKI
jgi:hypothetical protein